MLMKMNKWLHRQGGFTLVELMIAIAIVGIIAAVALPAYRQAVLKSHRSDAQITLSRLATLQERYYFGNNSYTDDFADIIAGAVSGQPVSSDEGRYSVALTLLGGGTGWSMTATAAGEQADDTDCATFTMTSTGARSAATSAAVSNPDCW